MAKAISLADAPPFSANPNIILKHTLQKTNIGKNSNKFYSMELQESSGNYRVFTHYGRTDLLANNPDYGTKQVRLFDSQATATKEYNSIKSRKMKKGYNIVELASSTTGSSKESSSSLTQSKKQMTVCQRR